MIISSLSMKGFRSVQDMSLSFEPGLTILVGENNTGKSTVSLALTKLLRQGIIGNDQIETYDFPYGTVGSMSIEAVVKFSADETENLLVSRLSSQSVPDHIDERLREWLGEQGSEIRLTLTRPTENPVGAIHWGTLEIQDSRMSTGAVQREGGTAWIDMLQRQASSFHVSADWEDGLKGTVELASNLGLDLSRYVLSRYKPIDEFRVRPSTTERSNMTESMEGSETASVLLNLKVHHNLQERERYGEIAKAFKTFFPNYAIEAVEQSAGSGLPDVQFYEDGQETPLPVANVSSGVHEVLTLVTNLVGRENLVVFLEHPEQHLHPHAMRALQRVLRDAVTRNQVIIVTHEPHFIDPGAAGSLRRVWRTSTEGTQVRQLDPSVAEIQISQIETALRLVGHREMVFARTVVLVEDESLQEFLIVVAPTLGYDIDAHGVSVIPTGGHGTHPPYHTLLDALGIPHVNLRDRSWGHNSKYPPDRFFSLGCELEQYLDHHGLSEIQKEAEKNVGKSHRRVARAVAEKLERARIPEVFDNVLKKAVNLATGRPLP